MRSRPKLEVRLVPDVVRPGRSFEVLATFDSRTETPVEFVDFTLVGTETIWSTRSHGGSWNRHQHVALGSRWRPLWKLARGRYNHSVRFALPPTAPPSYAGHLVEIEYLLAVHISIPWWPDRIERFVVPVVAGPLGAVQPAEPVVHVGPDASSALHPLTAELTVDRVVLEGGDTLAGAVAFTFARAARVRAVGLAFTGFESGTGPAGTVRSEDRRFSVRIHAGTPVDGEAIPFRVRLPETAPPSFQGAASRLSWTLDLEVFLGGGPRTLVRVPLIVGAPRSGGAATQSRAPIPLVGRERRTQLWAWAAQQSGLAYDAGTDVMRGRIGAVTVELTVESRDARGLCCVARLAWPSVGIDVSVKPAHWSDGLSPAERTVGHAAFDERFQVRGAEGEQVVALLNASVCDAMIRCDEATLDDRGASVAITGGVSDPARLGTFVTLVTRLAHALDAAMPWIPPPRTAATIAPGWATHASRIGARYQSGRVRILGAQHGVERYDLELVFDSQRDPVGTRIRFAFDPPLALPGGRDALSRAQQALCESLERDPSHTLSVDSDAVELTIATPVADPALLENRIDALAALAVALRGGAHAGPYR